MKDLSFVNLLPPTERVKILHGPAMMAPPGIAYNFEDPPNNNALTYGVCISATILCTLLVLLRLYSRVSHFKKLDVEDAISLVALGFFGGFIYSIWKLTLFPGFFVHQWNIRVEDLPRILYYIPVGSILYAMAMIFLKTGILLEWARLFVPRRTRDAFWWTCHITLITNILFFVANTFVGIFGCKPIRKQWILTAPGKCINISFVHVFTPIFNFVLDLLILVLPQKKIWNLKMTTRKKMGVALLFMTGIFTCISAGARVFSALDVLREEDMLYNVASMAIWATVELAGGFLILCVPSLPKLFAGTPWIRAVYATFISLTSRPSRKDKPHNSMHTITIGQRRQPHENPRFLFTDNSDFIPLADINITSEFAVQSEPAEATRVLHQGHVV